MTLFMAWEFQLDDYNTIHKLHDVLEKPTVMLDWNVSSYKPMIINSRYTWSQKL